MSKMRKTSALNYAFSVGKIRALEKFLIKQEVFVEAIESGLNEALRLFVESDLYSEELLHIKDSQKLEAVLGRELQRLKKLIGDLLLDKKLFILIELNNLKEVLETTGDYKSAFLEDYFRHLIDMHNIKTFLRLRILKEPEDRLKTSLIKVGFIKKETFLKLYAQELSFFIHRLEYVHKRNVIVNYASYLQEAIEKLEKENSFVYLEKAINDFLISILKPAKYLSFGPEALIAYYFAKVNEINLIRMIILAKLNNLSSQLVKERLNLVYA